MESDISEKSRLKFSKILPLAVSYFFQNCLLVRHINTFSSTSKCSAKLSSAMLVFLLGHESFFLSGIFQVKNTEEIMFTENC